MAGLTIAYSPSLGGVTRVEPEVADLVAAAVQTFARLGAHVELADPELGDASIAAWNAIWWPGMAYQLASFADRPDVLSDPGLLEGASKGRQLPATALIDAALQRAKLHAALAGFHQSYDLLLTPTLPLPAFAAGQLLPPGGAWGEAWTDWAPFSYPFNLTQQPAASLPCGLTANGLPVGLQLVAGIGQDGLLLRASRAFEAAQPFAMPPVPRQA